MSFARAFRGMLAVLLAGVLIVTLGPNLAGGQPVEPQDQPLEPRPEAESPAELYRRDCAYCHGPQGGGTSQGPSLKEVGTASVDFMLRTGRMPIADPDTRLRRRQAKYTDAEIRELVDYVGTFISGPPVPEVEPDPELLSKGGEVYRLNCAACHQFIGTGGPLIGSREAPTLHFATPIEVVESIRTGPGTMPKFSEEQLSEEDAVAVASFIALEVQKPRDEGGVAIGHYGPFAEGFVAWFAGIGSLLLAALWIGRRT